MSEAACVERRNGGKVHIPNEDNVLSETGATYYLSKYSKYMYINIYTRARTRPR